MLAIPGRVTVHIWSRVRSERLCGLASSLAGEPRKRRCRGRGRETYVHGSDHIVAVVAPELTGIRSTGEDRRLEGLVGGRGKTMAHDEVGIETKCDVHDELCVDTPTN
jgi:hypothetical protein